MPVWDDIVIYTEYDRDDDICPMCGRYTCCCNTQDEKD